MKTQFCSLNNYTSLKELLVKELDYSTNLTKKYISKKYLEKKIIRGDIVDLDLNFINNNIVNPIYSGSEIKIIYEDEVLIAVNKPAGIHGHPLDYNETNTVLNFLRSRSKLNFLCKKSENKERGLLYRIDELTSGLLIFIKDENLHTDLRINFSDSVKKKTYLALVEGELDIDRKVVNFLVGSGARGAKVIESDDGTKSVCYMKSLKKINSSTLIEVYLETGFRHQIRAQLSLLGYPILGDILYGAKPAQRMFLHALSYEFKILDRLYNLSAEREELFCNLLDADSLIKMS